MSWPFILNGQTPAGWRIEDVSDMRTGADFLFHPAAIVRGPRDLAAAVAELLNDWHRAGRPEDFKTRPPLPPLPAQEEPP